MLVLYYYELKYTCSQENYFLYHELDGAPTAQTSSKTDHYPFITV